MERTEPTGLVFRREWVIAATAALITLLAFTVWGGVPSGDRLVSFGIIVGIMIVLSCGFVAATWHLLFRALPAGQKRVSGAALSTTARQFIALLLAIGGLCLVVGPFWDETWHRQFGIPFGQDFFWRPHMLLYFGFGSSAILGFWGLYYLMTHAQGTLQQRFRANMLVGLIVMSSAFLMYVVPADPVWHIIYGKDLSAWSVPHLLLLVTIAIVMLMAALIHMSTIPARPWRGIHRLGVQDILPLLMCAGIMMPWLQILMIDWDRTLTANASLSTQFRPDWLMAGCLVFTTAFVGVFANRSLRFVGAATLAGVIALVMRYVMIQLFGVSGSMHYEAWIVALVPLLAIDAVMAYKLWMAKSDARWWESGLAGAAGLVIAVPLLMALYPGIPIVNPILLVLAVIAAGLGAGWLGTQIGDYVALENKQLEPETANAASYAPLVSMGTLVAFVAFVVFFINTAAPPV